MKITEILTKDITTLIKILDTGKTLVAVIFADFDSDDPYGCGVEVRDIRYMSFEFLKRLLMEGGIKIFEVEE